MYLSWLICIVKIKFVFGESVLLISKFFWFFNVIVVLKFIVISYSGMRGVFLCFVYKIGEIRFGGFLDRCSGGDKVLLVIILKLSFMELMIFKGKG